MAQSKAKVDLYHFVKEPVMGSRWVYTQTVTWEEYQRLAQSRTGEGDTWKGVLRRW